MKLHDPTFANSFIDFPLTSLLSYIQYLLYRLSKSENYSPPSTFDPLLPAIPILSNGFSQFLQIPNYRVNRTLLQLEGSH